MTMRFKYILLTLLGFGSSCSGVKESSRTPDPAPEEPVEVPIRLMYGVPVTRFRPTPGADAALRDSLASDTAPVPSAPAVENEAVGAGSVPDGQRSEHASGAE